MTVEFIPRPLNLPAGYETSWPAEGLLPLLWEPVALRPHHNELTFNLQALELGLALGAERDEYQLAELYDLRAGHWHAAFGTLAPPQTFRLLDQLMGPVLHYPDFRSVYARIDDAGRVSSYVSAVRNEGVLQDVLPFGPTLEDLMRIIGWDTESVEIPVGRWCPSGANGPRLS